MIHFYYKTAEQETFSSLQEIKKGCWVHVEDASLSDIQQICKWTDLELIDLQDSLDRYELPRVEKIRENILFHSRHPVELESHLHTMTLTILLHPEYFITISPSHCSIILSFMQKKCELSSEQKPELLVQLLQRCTQEFSTHIRKTRHNVMAQEKEISHVDSDDIYALTKYEEILNQYDSSLGAIRGALEHILQGKLPLFPKKEHELFDDVLNTVKQTEELCDIVLKNIRSLRDSYQIIFANNLTKTIKLLTSLTIIFSVPTMIASIYGMNVTLPLASKPNAFYFILSLLIGCAAICGYLFHRKKWL